MSDEPPPLDNDDHFIDRDWFAARHPRRLYHTRRPHLLCPPLSGHRLGFDCQTRSPTKTEHPPAPVPPARHASHLGAVADRPRQRKRLPHRMATRRVSRSETVILTSAPGQWQTVAMNDPNDLLRQLSDCIENARDIIEGYDDDPETCDAWLADAEQLLIAYDDRRRLQPAPGQSTRAASPEAALSTG
jgi:hypothetical protein